MVNNISQQVDNLINDNGNEVAELGNDTIGVLAEMLEIN